MVPTRRVFVALVAFAVWPLVPGTNGQVAADDPAPAAATREVWTFEKGSERVEVDVTDMPAALREATKAKFVADGYRFGEPRREAAPAAPAPVPAPAPGVSTGPGIRLRVPPLGPKPLPIPFGDPQNFEGAALSTVTRTMGKLILKYLEDKTDPVKAEVYEDFLRAIAEGFVAADPEHPGANGEAFAKAVGRLFAAMADPKKAAVARDILKTLQEGVVGERDDRPPAADRSRAWAGATIAAGTGADGKAVWRVTSVAAGSVAAQIGLEKGDAIVEMDGTAPSSEAWSKLGKSLESGGSLTLTVLRGGGKRIVFDVDLVK